MKNEQTLTVDELKTILLACRGQITISFTLTMDMDKKMNKKSRLTKELNPFLGIGLVKTSKVEGTVSFDYEKLMKERGDEAAGTGNWSQAILTPDGTPTPLSTRRDDHSVLYLRYEELANKSSYVNQDGTVVSREELVHYLPIHRPSTVAFRTASLNNIDQITISDKTYTLTHH